MPEIALKPENGIVEVLTDFQTEQTVIIPDFIDFKTTLEINGIGCEYELFKCGCCGYRWEDHLESCFNHKSKNKCISIRNLVRDTPEARRLYRFAVSDGFGKSLTPDEG